MKTEHRNIPKAGGSSNRLFQLKVAAAVLGGKLLITLTRLLGRGGTTLPGRAAIRIKPDIAAILARQLNKGTLVVTGTNGKTTTSALITGILKAKGSRCIHNQSGSNMAWGVVSALIGSASWRGTISADWALMEADEGAFPQIVRETKPAGIIATNIFRDQLDRYGEIDWIQAAIARGFHEQPPDGFQVVNADDPSLISLVESSGRKVLTYGFELEPAANEVQNTSRDLKTCPLCKKELHYDRIFFAHLGHYHCPACKFRRPQPDVQLTGLTANPDGSNQLQIQALNRQICLTSPLPGVYNYYNLLAAFTCALALDIPADIAVPALEKANPSFGRMESFEIDNRKLIMALIKNPVGANEVLRTIISGTENAGLLVAINDKIADGTDVSWLWDVDFEQLSAVKDKLALVIASGLRAWDMAVRYKYAGFDPAAVQVESNTARALKLALKKTTPGKTLYILPTYTAMLEIRRHLNRMGFGLPYWEDRS